MTRLASLSSDECALFCEAFFYLAYAKLVLLFPFRTIAPSLGEYMEETAYEANERLTMELSQISRAVQTISKYTFWESKCLVQAVAAQKMLAGRGIESTLYLGTARDTTGSMIAHAWLRSGQFVLTGNLEKNHFTVVGKFAKRRL